MKGAIKVDRSVKDPQLVEMFNQMMGTSDPDPEVITTKYEGLLTHVGAFISILSEFAGSPILAAYREKTAKGFAELDEFIKEAAALVNKCTLAPKTAQALSSEDIGKMNADRELMDKYIKYLTSKYDVASLVAAYKELKTCPQLKAILMTCADMKEMLISHKENAKTEKHSLEEKDNLSADFIRDAPGQFVQLFKFCSVEFKIMVDEYAPKKTVDYVLYTLYLLFRRAHRIYEIISTPDIDVEKFASILTDNIGTVRKHIPRCDQAFDKIANSVNMLRDNFSSYHKDFLVSGDPSIIIQHFISDVAQNASANNKLTRQFRQIISFYKKHMESRMNDPKLKHVFKMVGDNLNVLDEISSKEQKKRRDKLKAGDDVPAESADPSTTKKTPEEISEDFLPDHIKRAAKQKAARRRRKASQKKDKGEANGGQSGQTGDD